MMVVTDLNDVFVPLVDGFLVNIHESRSVIEKWVIYIYIHVYIYNNLLL